MSSTIISRLLSGDATIVQQFSEAKSFWNGFYAENGNKSEGQIAELLATTQVTFCKEVTPDDYPFGKEIMAIIAQPLEKVKLAIPARHRPLPAWSDARNPGC